MKHACRLPQTVIMLALAAAFQSHAQAQQDPAMPVVEIIGSTPLPGIGQARNEIAAPVQTVNRRDIERSGALELGEFMNRRLGSVHVNEMQGNPFQMDVNYRGYTASPLLGTPQGLSVYMDGVRMNQPFGDVVSWDLIPRAAIASMTLMPGSNPLFGLSTLGAALSLRTKDGKSDPGTVLQTTLGSNARRAVEFEHGGSNDQGLNWYLTGNLFNEDGWRDASPSHVRQLFGKLGWQDRDTDLKFTLAHADNDLTGNGLQEQRLLERNRSSAYTLPDQTRNRSTLFNLAATHAFNDALQLSGNVYYRDIRTSTYNGDINDDALASAVYLPGENATNTPFPSANCMAEALQAQDGGEPAELCNGLINRTQSKQRNHGASGQLMHIGMLGEMRNQLVVGGGYDASRTGFTQSSQLGYLNFDRTIAGVNAFGDGASGGNVDGEPYDTQVDLSGKITTWSLFASDTVSLQPNLHLTLSGRYNTTSVKNRDQLHLDDDPATLSGDHRFTRFNPAIGLSYSPTAALNVYGGYNESSRAPTAIELGCANPDQPCKLPNAMAGDPPLNQVVARTLEAGVRGTASGVQWNAGLFRAQNRDDILFVADNQAGYGYFKNFGQTRRQGLELGASSKLGKLNVGAQYTWLDATYQSVETVNGSSNSSNSSNEGPGQDGTIAIRAGDQIPLIPRQMLKLYADVALSPDVMLNADMVAISSSLARGNENNGHQPDGKYYLGPGRSAGYAVFNLGASMRLARRWQLQARVNNVFDTRYSTAAQLGAAGFDASGNFQARPFGGSGAAGYALQHSTFYAPGAPRLFSVVLRYAFGQKGT